MDKDIRILTNLILKNHYRIVGITGISGAGKSTLAYRLKERLIQQNKKVISISLDDFVIYQTYRNFLSLRWRSQPESHNIEWLLEVLNDVKKKNEFLCFPRFNKAINEVGLIEIIPYCVDVLILDGWLLGSYEKPIDYIQPFLDYLIYVECSIPIAKKRRFEREKEFQDKNLGFSMVELEEFWNSVILPLYNKNKKDIIKNSNYLVFNF